MGFLRTKHVVSPAGFGLGYRSASPRNLRARGTWPKIEEFMAKFSSVSATADNKTGTKPLCGKVLNQNQVGACTSESTVKADRITLIGKGIALPLPAGVEDFSQRILYAQTREIMRAATAIPNLPLQPITDSGAEPDDCITAESILGLAPMGSPVSGYYNDVDSSNVNDEATLSDEEKTTILTGSYDVSLVSSNRSQIWQTAINQNRGITTALFVDTQNFMAYDGSAPVQKIDLNDPQGGGHQICGPCYWYTSSSLGLVWGWLNSWGENWGLAGFVEMTDKCLMTAIDNSIIHDVTLGEVAAVNASRNEGAIS